MPLTPYNSTVQEREQACLFLKDKIIELLDNTHGPVRILELNPLLKDTLYFLKTDQRLIIEESPGVITIRKKALS